MRKQVVMVVMLMMMSMYPASAQDSPQVIARWTPPTEGSPVVVYQLEVWEDGVPFMVSDTPDTSYVFTSGTFAHGVPYLARVRGQDAQDRYGPWSDWSEPYVFDAGPPGGCGTPSWEVGKNVAK